MHPLTPDHLQYIQESKCDDKPYFQKCVEQTQLYLWTHPDYKPYKVQNNHAEIWLSSHILDGITATW